MNDDQVKAINDQFAKLNKRFDDNDDQFAKINKRFDDNNDQFAKLNKRADDGDDQFTRLYAYMEQRFDNMERRFDDVATKDSVDRLAATVDSLIGYYKDSQVEQAAQDAKWERLLEWAREVSKKTGVPLKDL